MSVKTRLVLTLASAGVPVDAVAITGDSSADVTYMEWATQEQRDVGAALLAAFDWSPEAQAAWDRDQVTAVAKGIVLTGDDAVTRATRAGSLALMRSLQEARAKINELVEHVNNATGSAIAPLVTGSTFEQAMGDVVSLLEAGAV
jgi:hypothetical protein